MDPQKRVHFDIYLTNVAKPVLSHCPNMYSCYNVAVHVCSYSVYCAFFKLTIKFAFKLEEKLSEILIRYPVIMIAFQHIILILHNLMPQSVLLC